MKPHLILRAFKGSQNGIDSESFEAGTTRDLSHSLVQALGGPNGGYVKAADAAADEIANAHPALAEAVREGIAGAELQPRDLADGETLEEAELPDGVTAGERVNPADLRETKVVEPDETKSDLDAMSHKELQALAKQRGIKTEFGMKKDALVAALRAE